MASASRQAWSRTHSTNLSMIFSLVFVHVRWRCTGRASACQFACGGAREAGSGRLTETGRRRRRLGTAAARIELQDVRYLCRPASLYHRGDSATPSRRLAGPSAVIPKEKQRPTRARSLRALLVMTSYKACSAAFFWPTLMSSSCSVSSGVSPTLNLQPGSTRLPGSAQP